MEVMNTTCTTVRLREPSTVQARETARPTKYTRLNQVLPSLSAYSEKMCWSPVRALKASKPE